MKNSKVESETSEWSEQGTPRMGKEKNNWMILFERYRASSCIATLFRNTQSRKDKDTNIERWNFERIRELPGNRKSRGKGSAE
jgi:hypothetical protein